jgi:hypothetical protein
MEFGPQIGAHDARHDDDRNDAVGGHEAQASNRELGRSQKRLDLPPAMFKGRKNG